jgi:two-component sensor histidine kinase
MLGRIDLEGIIVRERTVSAAAAWTVGAVAFAALFRWMIDKGENGVELATFFPAILLTATLLPWPFAVLSAVLSLVVASILFMDAFPPNPTGSRMVLLLVYVLTAGMVILLCQALRRMIMQLNYERSMIQEANTELQHRMGNALQIVKAMASRASRGDDPKTFYQVLIGRIEAMAAANKLLGISRHTTGRVDELVEAALAPFDRDRIQTGGTACVVGGDVGMILTMALHELATNATKYGALSNDHGKVALDWGMNDGELSVTWRERGGPPVVPPIRQGIGSRLLSPHGALKKSDQSFEPAGLACHLTFRI